MPELPEVETVRRGLAPHLEGARIGRVVLNRPDLRFPFPPDFAGRLTGREVERVERRAKYLLFRLSGGLTWLSHLGMTGSYGFSGAGSLPTGRYYAAPEGAAHQHVLMAMEHPRDGAFTLVYTDARRFGFMDLIEDDAQSPFLRELGPEPLSNSFNAAAMAERFSGKNAPVKAALLDQRVVAGLGNIYASEALHRAGIHPEVAAGRLVTKAGQPSKRLERLAAGVRTVLEEAVKAGGSTLRDFRDAEGGSGYFQHRFAVYDREGQPCPRPGCTGTVRRIVQAGRSTFFCPTCQKR